MSRNTQKKRSKNISHSAPERRMTRDYQFKKGEAESYYAPSRLTIKKSTDKFKLPLSKLPSSRMDSDNHMPLYDLNHQYSSKLSYPYSSHPLSKKGVFVMSLLVLPAVFGAMTPPVSTFRRSDLYTDLNGVSFTREMKHKEGSMTLSFSAAHIDSLSVDTLYTPSTAMSATPFNRNMTFSDLDSVSQRNVFEGAGSEIKISLQSSQIKGYNQEAILYSNSALAQSNSTALEQQTTLKKLEKVSFDTKTENDDFVSTHALNASRIGFFNMKEKPNRVDSATDAQHTDSIQVKNESIVDSLPDGSSTHVPTNYKSLNMIIKEADDEYNKVKNEPYKTSSAVSEYQIFGKPEDRVGNRFELEKPFYHSLNHHLEQFQNEKAYDERAYQRYEALKLIGGEKGYAEAFVKVLYDGDIRKFHEQVGSSNGELYINPIETANNYQEKVEQGRVFCQMVYEKKLLTFKPSTLQYMKDEITNKIKSIKAGEVMSDKMTKQELIQLGSIFIKSIEETLQSISDERYIEDKPDVKLNIKLFDAYLNHRDEFTESYSLAP